MNGIKDQIRTRYDEIARRGEKAGCGCGTSMIGDHYEAVEGYVAGADLGLGCGMPTEAAGLEAGHTVLDLGSGAGLDAFIARRIVGDAGRVLGVDMTDSMVQKARANASDLGYENVEFRLGDIEDLPVDSASVDVVISNCVLNLIPAKTRAFAEMFRVLKPGGHFCISDVAVRGQLPESLKRSAELYAGCVAGTMREDDYLSELRSAGFDDVEVVREKAIEVPDEALLQAAMPEEVSAFRRAGGGLVSITVRGTKRS